MSADNVVKREGIRIAEAQIDMRLRRKMEDGVNLVRSQAFQDIGIVCKVSMEELEVRAAFQHPGIVERTAVIELVETHDVVGIRIFCHQVTDEPRSTVYISSSLGTWHRKPT